MDPQINNSHLLPNVSELLGPLDLFEAAWKIYKQRFWKFLIITLIPLLAWIPLGLFGVGTGLYPKNLTLNLRIFTGVLVMLTIVIGLVLQIWSQAALICAIKDSAENLGIGESYRRAKSKIFPLLWVSFLSSVIISGGFVLLIIPGIILSVFFSLSSFILVTEGERGMNSLLKSREYVRGHWGAVFWRLLFLVGILIVFGLGIGTLFAVLNYSKIGGSATNFLGLILTPLFVIYVYLIYENLRILKGNFNFVPRGKVKYIVVAVIGIILIPILFAAALLGKFKLGTKLNNQTILQYSSTQISR